MHYTTRMSITADKPNSSESVKGVKSFVIDTNVPITYYNLDK
jgi:hypothetical protein